MLEIRNSSGSMAELYDNAGNYVMSLNFIDNAPKDGFYTLGSSLDLDVFPTKRVLKLKKAGFSADEIIEIIKELK